MRRATSRPTSLFQERAFVNLWLVGAASSTTRWLEFLVVGIYVFDVSGSPFLVALMTVMRMLPLALFGAFAGAITERVSRRTILLSAFAIMFFTALAVAWLAATGRLALWHVALASWIGGMFWVLDFPVRRTIIGDIVPAARLGTAMSLDTVTSNGTRMLGPLVGGALLAVLGLDGAFLLTAGLYALSFVAIWWLRHEESRPAGGEGESVMRRTLEGFALARSDRLITGVLMVTVIFNLWGFPFVSMVPVIGRDVLGLDSFGVGLLAACEGAGALIGALLVATIAPVAQYRRIYVLGLTFCLIMILGFAQSRAPIASGVLLAATGVAAACFACMQSTLVLMCSPAHARHRMMGVLVVCIGTAPVGFLHLGLLADAIGATTAVTVIAAQGLVGVALVVWRWPEILRRQEPG